jgi:hypothetical protein
MSWSHLELAVNWRTIQGCEYIGFPDYNTYSVDSTVTPAAWEKIFTVEKSAESEELRRIFPEGQSFPDFDLSDVHKVILCILPLSIDAILLDHQWRSQVNHRDAWGRMPLHWAARKGDSTAVRVLIYTGVDVNSRDNDHKTALHYAAYHPNPECLQLLLKAGALATVEDKDAVQPIHWAARCGELAHLEALVARGADPCVEDNRGGVPLQWSSYANKVENGEFLIGHGADINKRDNLHGNSILFAAISSRAPDFTSMLIDKDVDTSACNKSGFNVLHQIAENGDERLLDMLEVRIDRFRRLSTTKLDGKKRTPRGILATRLNPSEPFKVRFEQFLSAIDAFGEEAQPEPVTSGAADDGQSVPRPRESPVGLHMAYTNWLLWGKVFCGMALLLVVAPKLFYLYRGVEKAT